MSEYQIPEDLKEEYKRLAAVRREIGDYSSATRSTIEDMNLIERIALLEAQNAKLREALVRAGGSERNMLPSDNSLRAAGKERQ